jgi:iron only hydrogenase large subunit-like protein
VVKRMQKLYSIDSTEAVRASHHNADIQRLYAEFLGAPLSHKSHELLHTHYTSRSGEKTG